MSVDETKPSDAPISPRRQLMALHELLKQLREIVGRFTRGVEDFAGAVDDFGGRCDRLEIAMEDSQGLQDDLKRLFAERANTPEPEE